MRLGPSPRATDADREQVIGLLRTQLAVGTLTPEEFYARAESATRARRLTDLDRLTRDLPTTTITTERNPLRPLITGALVAVAAFLLLLVVVLVVMGIGAMLGG
ncbi:DUF1707 domain-containing protein [Nocardia otitidiscaviarum]|uniref:DUF1707 SHOCT-like domain-containing protein n=1 Tax=Nocardia otitidiscaviarum TaxID=1823 RepID=UPI0004A6B5B2|nr:DUF1707 domain-containing protein [Nocardia otitidiscaviarum]MBF6137026.1 DUF1707 domain-containing protein [Nocardia otitidiscaviarum]MBF6179969.1 DUF1707 domain-containing protein [Nocardia otitidiscaviarum]MBF6485226.1 DUF1707 domain-containing protein [Nocardia otitidiscaviarum]